MFRKRQAAAAPVVEDAINDELLLNIPELEEELTPHEAARWSGAPTGAPQGAWAGLAPPAAAPATAPTVAAPPAVGAGGQEDEMVALVAQIRRNVEHALVQELGKVEGTFVGRVRELEASLDETRVELEAARAENERLRVRSGEYERKVAALKEFASRIDRL